MSLSKILLTERQLLCLALQRRNRVIERFDRSSDEKSGFSLSEESGNEQAYKKLLLRKPETAAQSGILGRDKSHLLEAGIYERDPFKVSKKNNEAKPSEL